MNSTISLFRKPFFHDTQCSICHEEYDDVQNRCTILACGHLFHTDCFTKWQNVQPKCPICKRNVVILSYSELTKQSIQKGRDHAGKVTLQASALLVFILAICTIDSLVNPKISSKIILDQKTLVNIGLSLATLFVVAGTMQCVCHLIPTAVQKKLQAPREINYERPVG